MPALQLIARGLKPGTGIRAAAVMVGDPTVLRACRFLSQVPARELPLGALIEQRVGVAGVEHAATLRRQLESYRMQPALRDVLADWRPAPHTDLVQVLNGGCVVVGAMLRTTSHHGHRPSTHLWRGQERAGRAAHGQRGGVDSSVDR